MLETKRYPTNEWAKIEGYGTGFNGKAKMRNLSKGGAYLELHNSSLSLEKGDLLRITVSLTELGRERRMSAEVVWFRPPAGGTAGIGVSFIKPEEAYARLANKFSY